MAHNETLDPLALSSINANHRNFATTSSKYNHIPTTFMLDIFADHGFHAVASNQAKVRKPYKEGFQRHTIKLENPLYANLLPGIATPQLLLRNSHDGTGAVDFMAALKIWLCSNGAVSFSEALEKVRVLHRGFTPEKLETAIKDFTSRLPLITNEVHQWLETPLDLQEAVKLAQTAIELKFDPLTDTFGNTLNNPYPELKNITPHLYPVTPQALLVPRRSQDTIKNLWGAYNVIQENIIERPQSRAATINPKTGRRRDIMMRPVKGIDANIKLNQGLWKAAADLNTLKNGFSSNRSLSYNCSDALHQRGIVALTKTDKQLTTTQENSLHDYIHSRPDDTRICFQAHKHPSNFKEVPYSAELDQRTFCG